MERTRNAKSETRNATIRNRNGTRIWELKYCDRYNHGTTAVDYRAIPRDINRIRPLARIVVTTCIETERERTILERDRTRSALVDHYRTRSSRAHHHSRTIGARARDILPGQDIPMKVRNTSLDNEPNMILDYCLNMCLNKVIPRAKPRH